MRTRALFTVVFISILSFTALAQHVELQKISGKRHLNLKANQSVVLINDKGEKLEGKIITIDQDSIGIETGFAKTKITKWALIDIDAVKKETFWGYTAQTSAILFGGAIAVAVTGLIFPNQVGFDDFMIASTAAFVTFSDFGEETFHIGKKYQIEFIE